MSPPTPEELLAAHGKTIPDVLEPGVEVVFCGINPGLYSAATGRHFARPGNRFWPALHLGGFTDGQLHPSEQSLLLDLGLGLTNVVARATATAAELTAAELRRGAALLEEKIQQFAPRYLAILGLGAFRTGFGRRGARIGPQAEPVGKARVWVLPNPSGLNAHYQLGDLAEQFAALRRALKND